MHRRNWLTHSPALWRRLLSLLALALLSLGACQDLGAPSAAPPSATSLPITAFDDLLATNAPDAERTVSTLGYLLADPAEVILAGAIAFDRSGKPQPLDTGIAPLWLGVEARAQLQGVLRSSANIEYASVIARGRLSRPGRYGPAGRYRYQLSGAQFTPLVAQETTIAELLQRPSAFERRLIRLSGGLLVRETSALLVDRLGAGGLPEPKAQQIKLRAPIRDQLVLARLKGSPSGVVRFGQVQLEGLWSAGALWLVSITITQ